jgi:hypothetical protein
MPYHLVPWVDPCMPSHGCCLKRALEHALQPRDNGKEPQILIQYHAHAMLHQSHGVIVGAQHCLLVSATEEHAAVRARVYAQGKPKLSEHTGSCVLRIWKSVGLW